MSYKVKNFMEICVEQTVDKMIEESGVCGCEKCRADIEAIALNSLPTKYIVTEKGEVFSKLSAFNPQFNIDVMSAVSQAIEIVKKNARH